MIARLMRWCCPDSALHLSRPGQPFTDLAMRLVGVPYVYGYRWDEP